MSEANSIGLDGLDERPVRPESPPAVSGQNSLFGVAHVVLTPKIIIEGPTGSLNVSLTVEEFSTGQWLACEVRPGLRFPQDLDLALDWIVALSRSWCAQISPF